MFTPRMMFATVPVLGVLLVVLVVGTAMRPARAQDEKKDEKDKAKPVEKDKAKLREKDKVKPFEPFGQPRRVNRTTVLVLPVKSQPDAETIMALEKVFGKELEISN